MKTILIASSKKWFLKNKEFLKFIKKRKIITISDKKKLNIKNLNKIRPGIIFFPHWSFKVNKNIIKKFNCICFHTSPLPYGRGGSPIQNLILKKFKIAPVCALKMTNKIDSGPIYLKENVSLSGNLDEIFNRISLKILKMIKILIRRKVKPKKQVGRIFNFKRLKNHHSKITKNETINQIYDKIRMLSSDDYPHAYILKDNFKIFLKNSELKKKVIYCEAKIIKNK